MKSQLCIYYREEPEKDRFVKGDRFIRPIIRRLVRGRRTSGIKKVFLNLCKGLDLLKIDYVVNRPFKRLSPADKVVVLGKGRYALEGYTNPNLIIAGISLVTHPSEWPDLCISYPIARYLQHSEWANNVYKPYYGTERCETWPAGIDTAQWKPGKGQKEIDFLIYNKIYWDIETTNKMLRNPIIDYLNKKGYSYTEIKYGNYKERDYRKLLNKCRAMIFLAGHESQGFACCEAMSMNVPVFAWDMGLCMDPARFKWGHPVIPASSVPFFNERCGAKFKDLSSFYHDFEAFRLNVISGHYSPRDYILENLSLKKSAEQMLNIINTVYQ
ncbi:glycosyltransferase [Pedobacter heparinus]|uniref:Glycosyltransferase n=1 Tax=Pedobacter heparinus (strain ATCC 13125 / DSM 2366 / CIP 104194 / JCM 7457 / NBRC 12017 / NCIMB 9290 / NRRL B-14731 / HIM 762-3) TaxID=485917 RepID=C6XVL7_PEDHD|nr:glycosyltransferase [Pedobacter heparinus]ACU06092.1 conserved hypothetical protein [Pedobacter heparinus DSM 2366]